MTDKEAMKLALDALKGVLDDAPKVLDASISGGLYEVVQCRDAITALKKRLAQTEQEPVAVYGYCPECGAKGVMRERRPDGNDKCAKGHTYPSSKATTPPQRTEPDDIASIIACRNILDAQPVPPRRTWVGLTDEDIGDAYVAWDDTNGASFADFARAIEAKLKQKNGYAEENT